MKPSRKLLTLGHSYIVALNRRLANEMSRIGSVDWDITVAAPIALKGDLRPLQLQSNTDDCASIKSVSVVLDRSPQLMMYHDRLREILQQGWDLVHCWEEPYVVSGGQVAWWTPQRTPLIYFTFQNQVKHYPPPFNWIEAYAMNRATGWICAGETVAQTLRPRSGYQLPMRTIPLGVDVDWFAPSIGARQAIRQQLEWDEKVPVIGYLGRFVPEKGLDRLMRVLDHITEPWRALIVGTGAMEAALRSWASRYGDRVRICTTVHHDQVSHYLNAMDLLCAPSQTTPRWREQFGRMIIEAFACGVPVIGSDSGEIPYVIGDAGMIVAEADDRAWIKAISDLLSNPQERSRLSKTGIDRAHSVFAWPIVAKQHLEFFDAVVDLKPKAIC